MNEIYHILNGDALGKQFPRELHGERILTRECLIDGNVQGSSMDDFFETRAKFIGRCYGKDGESFYYRNVVPELKKIQNLPEGVEVNLWFEDDLFCQVNLWFVVHLLNRISDNSMLYLIRPKVGCEYNFGRMNTSELMDAYRNRTTIAASDARMISDLWGYYQADDCEKMLECARVLQSTFPFLLPAVQAHRDRIPAPDNPGAVVQTLHQIINELETTEFVPIFKEFNKRAEIYGLGDTQVKRILAEMDDRFSTCL